MEASTDYFITLVECNRILYDKSSKDFKNAAKKEAAWVRIANNSGMSGKTLEYRQDGKCDTNSKI